MSKKTLRIHTTVKIRRTKMPRHGEQSLNQQISGFQVPKICLQQSDRQVQPMKIKNLGFLP
jgi:hypothetical protein